MSEKIDDDDFNDDVIKYTKLALREAAENPNDQKSEFFINTNDVFIQPFLKAETKSEQIALLKAGLLDNNFDTLFYFHGDQFIGLFAHQLKLLQNQTVAYLFRYYLLPSSRRKFINYKVFLYYIEHCRNQGIDILVIGNSGKIESGQRTDEQELTYGFLCKLQERNVVKDATINLEDSAIVFAKA